jgi:hypothetical protein
MSGLQKRRGISQLPDGTLTAHETGLSVIALANTWSICECPRVRAVCVTILNSFVTHHTHDHAVRRETRLQEPRLINNLVAFRLGYRRAVWKSSMYKPSINRTSVSFWRSGKPYSSRHIGYNPNYYISARLESMIEGSEIHLGLLLESLSRCVYNYIKTLIFFVTPFHSIGHR